MPTNTDDYGTLQAMREKKVTFASRMRITYSEFNISELDGMLAGKF